MIKLVIFDLDGVLVDIKKIHFNTLNESLREIDCSFVISWDEHLSKFDGLKTKQKLNILSLERSLPIENHEQIWTNKQNLTISSLENLDVNFTLIEMLENLSKLGYKLGCCSNSIKETVLTVLSKLGIKDYFNIILSNEDVNNSKPHPEIYWKAMSEMNCLPKETLILEDSPYGLLSANRANANILRVKNSSEVTLSNIMNNIESLDKQEISHSKWSDKKLNVLIPMAGAGSRFEQAGYNLPKPLININKNPMIKCVTNNINIDANYIYIVQKKHREKYNLDTILNLIVPDCTIIEVDGLTEGAACTSLLAKELINNDTPLFFANSDQFVEWNSVDFMYKMQETDVDGGIVIFENSNTKWSFAKVDNLGYVTEVAEKNPISNLATVGFYYWKKGSDFVKYAEDMINKNIRVNNEFYVCPVFNQAIQDGKKILTYKADKMWGLGTPEDLEFFIKNYAI